MLMNTMTSFIACALGGYLNALLMRKTELEKGIEIYYTPES